LPLLQQKGIYIKEKKSGWIGQNKLLLLCINNVDEF